MAVTAELSRRQFSAVAGARWAMLIHSLKTLSGKLEAITRALAIASYAGLGVVIAIGLGGFAYWMAAKQTLEALAVAIWFLCVFWQVFPIMKTGFTNTFDAANLLRFPVTYRTYFSLRLFYGALEPVALVAVLGFAGITVGVLVGAPVAAPGCALALLLLTAMNVVLTQVLLSWFERWMAQRRTRELLGVLFFILIMGLQMVGPLVQAWEHQRDTRGKPPVTRDTAMMILSAERALPPGLAALTIGRSAKGEWKTVAESVAGLALYLGVLVAVLDVRLRAQYRGENLSESAAPKKSTDREALRLGWRVPGLTSAMSALFEKEVRYLMRSGPMLLTFVMPTIVLVLFWGRFANTMPPKAATVAFPVMVGYSLLLLTNVVFNSFGTDHAGVQSYFMLPVPLRDALRAKNLVHGTLFIAEVVVLYAGVTALRGTPGAWITLTTLLALPFALALEFSAGNLMSVLAPKKLSFQMMGRQRTSQLTVFIALVTHGVILASSGFIFMLGTRVHAAISPAIFLVLDLGAIYLYRFALLKSEELGMSRREAIFAALCRE